MLSENFREALRQTIAIHLEKLVTQLQFDPVGGGSINQGFRVVANDQFNFFLKTNPATSYPDFFEKEKQGLSTLAASNSFQTPSVIYCGTIGNTPCLLMEWISAGPCSKSFWEIFGENLARLHQHHYERFGFPNDNYLGSLPQQNSFCGNWPQFFITMRLRPQIEMATKNGYFVTRQLDTFEKLFQVLPVIFNEEKASLLHGDLWNGNFICTEQSQPVLIDPAVYYGHRSMDLAMTTLFGGFDQIFYQAYHYHFPLPANYDEQWKYLTFIRSWFISIFLALAISHKSNSLWKNLPVINQLPK